jgi:hypothetical protein
MQITTFLKRVLILDSASCLSMGALLVAGGDSFARLLGLPAPLAVGAGLALLPLGFFILWLGTRTSAPAALIWLIILGNVAWSAESMVTAFATPGITGFGTLFVLGQAGAVLALAAFEYVGLQKARLATA